jgi:SAM-dependent methyltransferase
LSQLYSLLGGENTYSRELDLRNDRSQNLYDLLRKFVNVTTKLRILDIGGGVGQVCKVFAEYGHDVHVLDMSHGTPVHSGITMHSCALEDFRTDRPFDLVILSHILEHVWHPTAFLEGAKAMTRDGGYLYLEVPFELYTPFIFRKLGDPCHVGYFTLATLCRLLEKTGLVSAFAERALGSYNARRVMILRALVQKLGEEGTNKGVHIRSGWWKAVLEMAHPVQIYFVLSVLQQRLRYLVAVRR